MRQEKPDRRQTGCYDIILKLLCSALQVIEVFQLNDLNICGRITCERSRPPGRRAAQSSRVSKVGSNQDFNVYCSFISVSVIVFYRAVCLIPLKSSRPVLLKDLLTAAITTGHCRSTQV